MHLVKTKIEQIQTLMSWLPDQETSFFWGGPGLRYPFTEQTFIEDIKWHEISSYSMIDSHGALLGFGQYYEKAGRCHLARLVVSPLHRSKGIGHRFIKSLMEIGMEDLNSTECSLFVIRANENAMKCYLSLNFKMAEYPPEHANHSNISFMVSMGA